jgi:hypothetical protein
MGESFGKYTRLMNIRNTAIDIAGQGVLAP